jgi:hypothetical protein
LTHHDVDTINTYLLEMENNMSKLYAFIGEATHQDSLDGIQDFAVLAEDAPNEIKVDVLSMEEELTMCTVDRAMMDSIAKSIEMNSDTHGIGNGYLLDLTGDYACING